MRRWFVGRRQVLKTVSTWSVSLSALAVIGAAGTVVSVAAKSNDIERNRMNATVAEANLKTGSESGCAYGVNGGVLHAGTDAPAVRTRITGPHLWCAHFDVDKSDAWLTVANQHEANALADLAALKKAGDRSKRNHLAAVGDLGKSARMTTCVFLKTDQLSPTAATQRVGQYKALAGYTTATDHMARADVLEKIVSYTVQLRERNAIFDPPRCFRPAPRAQAVAQAPAEPIAPAKPVLARRPKLASNTGTPGGVSAHIPITAAPAQEADSTARPSQAPSPNLRGEAGPIPDAVWRAMRGITWRPGIGCPAREALAYLRVPYVDFRNQRQTGTMIVARDVANDVLDVFETLAREEFPIQRMELVHRYDGNDTRSMNANNTSAFNCRRVTGGKRLSEHAFGRAIDINPIQNPYVRRGRVQPRAGRAYDSRAERLRERLGVIRANEVVTRAFSKIGWKWGGYWRSLKDYQHFSKSGR